MAKKKVEISFGNIKKAFQDIGKWIQEFFKNANTYELVAVGAIGVGVGLIIAGIIII